MSPTRKPNILRAHASQEFDAVEFYAGRGNLTRFMKACSYKCASLDILYPIENKRKPKHNTNCMDILSDSGFACLACKTRLATEQSKPFA